MKKLLFTVVFALFGSVLFANHGNYGVTHNSDLNIKMWDNSTFTIILDHNVFQKTRNFSLKDIAPGKHYVKIIKKKRNHHGHGYFVQTVYNGKINIPAKRKVFVKVEGKNRLSFKFFKKVRHNNSYNDYYESNNYDEWDANCALQNDYYGNNNDYHNNYGPMAMDEYRFNQLINAIKNASFDKTKLQIANQAIAANNVNTYQVGIIIEQFTFESNRLAFAKNAYHKTIDKESYFVINDKFTFSSSVSDLNYYISHSI